MAFNSFLRCVTSMILSGFTLMLSQVNAQPLQTDSVAFVVDVEEIMQLPRNKGYQQEIVSASRKAESLFDAPLAASVLTKEEIKASGATNIMEALRLVPGLVVRQIANGVYNIHIRGMDWLPYPSNGETLSGETKLLLVMIDNRPVFNYIQGTTFWETLPVGLHDVERIEVVRGPSASLFGPNGVMGVINIITAKPLRDGPYAIADIRTGSFDTNLFNATLGYQFNDKVNFTISANKQVRGRTTDLFYHRTTDEYQEIGSSMNGYLDGVISNEDVETVLYPDLNTALNKEGLNAALNLAFAKDVQASVRFGLENTLSYNTISPTLETVLNRLQSETHYFDTDLFVKGFNMKLSYLTGVQNPLLGIIDNNNVNFLDFDVAYDLKIGEKLTIRPSVSLRDAQFSPSIKNDFILRNGQDAFEAIVNNLSPSLPPNAALGQAIGRVYNSPLSIINEDAGITNYAISLRAEYLAFNKRLRLIGAIRGDQFSNLSNKVYYSYQLTSTYKMQQNHLLRVGIGRANSSQYIIDTQSVIVLPARFNTGSEVLTAFNVRSGNPELNPTENNSIEIGYRGKITGKFSIDVDLFRNEVRRLSARVRENVNLELDAEPFPYAEIITRYRNLDAIIRQNGVTVSLNYTGKNFWFRPFITLQETRQDNYSPYTVTEEYAQNFTPTPDQHWRNDITEIEHTATPSYFGGFFLNYNFLNRLTLNFNSYLTANQEIIRSGDDEPGSRYNIGTHYILNTNLSYKLHKQASMSFSVRDITSNSASEHYYTDPIRTMYFIGFSFKL